MKIHFTKRKRSGRWLAVCMLSCWWLTSGGMMDAGAQSEREPAEFERTWTSADGRQVVGRVVDVEDGNVVLMVGGREFRVPSEELSDADRRWLQTNQHKIWSVAAERRNRPRWAGDDLLEKMIAVPGQRVRRWKLTNGTEFDGLLRGSVREKNSHLAIVSMAGRDRPVAIPMWELSGDDMRHLGKVAAPNGELVPFPGEGRVAEELTAMGLAGYEYRSRKGQSSVNDGSRNAVRFRWFTPDLTAQETYPLVLFLHGLGENGTDNVRQFKHREPLAFLSAESQSRHPCFFMAPQANGPERFNGADLNYPNALMRVTLEAMRHMQLVEHAGRIDWRRIYVTGLSSGGHGAYMAVCLRPEWFAAAVPISAGMPADYFHADNVRPMWAFYNRADGEAVRRNVDTLQRHFTTLGQPLRITEFDRGGHNAWSRAYRHPELAEWLFSQELPER